MDLTVIMTHWRRRENFDRVVAALDRQTLPHRRFLWSNAPDDPESTTTFDWVVRSSLNAKCCGRWMMATQADTPWTVILDDDLEPTDASLLAWTVQDLEKHGRPVGAVGVQLLADRTYARSRHVGYAGGDKRVQAAVTDEPVDVVKGRYFAAPTASLKTLSIPPMDDEDDICVSSQLGGGIVGSRLTTFRELPQGDESFCYREDHRDRRERSRRRWFGSR